MAHELLYKIVRKPLLTEKSVVLKEDNKFCFRVAYNTNKVEIRKAIEELFNVKVKDVNTMIIHGKVKRMGRNSGRRPSWKKAIVTLQPGQKIEFFQGM